MFATSITFTGALALCGRDGSQSCIVAEEYVLVCQRYIELNPVRATMVAIPSDYRGSSYRCNGLGRSAQLWTPPAAYLALGRQNDERLMAYQTLFTAYIDQVLLEDIRAATNKGLALGSERFKALTGNPLESAHA